MRPARRRPTTRSRPATGVAAADDRRRPCERRADGGRGRFRILLRPLSGSHPLQALSPTARCEGLDGPWNVWQRRPTRFQAGSVRPAARVRFRTGWKAGRPGLPPGRPARLSRTTPVRPATTVPTCANATAKRSFRRRRTGLPTRRRRRHGRAARPPRHRSLHEAQHRRAPEQQAGAHRTAPVGGQPVPDQYYALPAVARLDLLQYLDQCGGVVAAGLEVETQARTENGVGGLVADGCSPRRPFPARPVPKERSAPRERRCGGSQATARRLIRRATRSRHVCSPPLLMRGHSCATQRAISVRSAPPPDAPAVADSIPTGRPAGARPWPVAAALPSPARRPGRPPPRSTDRPWLHGPGLPAPTPSALRPPGRCPRHVATRSALSGRPMRVPLFTVPNPWVVSARDLFRASCSLRRRRCSLGVGEPAGCRYWLRLRYRSRPRERRPCVPRPQTLKSTCVAVERSMLVLLFLVSIALFGFGFLQSLWWAAAAVLLDGIFHYGRREGGPRGGPEPHGVPAHSGGPRSPCPLGPLYRWEHRGR